MNQKVNFNECQNLLAFVYFKLHVLVSCVMLLILLLKIRNCTDALFDHFISFLKNINDLIRCEQFLLLSLR